MKIENIINEIITELNRAETKHPMWPTDLIHAVAIVAEESGEAVQAALQHQYEDGSLKNIKTELIHTATTAIRMLKNLPD